MIALLILLSINAFCAGVCLTLSVANAAERRPWMAMTGAATAFAAGVLWAVVIDRAMSAC